MYDQNEGKLEQVKDPAELKIGMACKLIRCGYCTKNHIFNISKITYEKNSKTVTPSGYTESYTGLLFVLAPETCKVPGCDNSETFGAAIPEGRLFKIVDENPISDIVEEIKAISKLEEKLIKFKESIKE